ncbi:hypothetical protein BJY01DRAFT_245648 [Aspergillus pseudoustus]|uniref:Zn(2)-C6 fungal-type domain-containing protein n=1 Tax=Aspergillus pseudoustus TaxID=1810923 RepID=A0ABR4KFT1_9EURO
MRPLSACMACRERRKRCQRPRGSTSCEFCTARRLECLMAPKPDAESDGAYELLKHHRHGTDLYSASAAALSQDAIVEFANLYFETVQGGFPSLFHRPTFMGDVADGSVPLILLYGVIGLSARFSVHPSLSKIEPWERGRPYAKEAERMLDLHNVTLTTIQACILLAINLAIEGESMTECVFLAIAARMALLLDLPNAAARTPLEQELNQRVWWSIVTTDTWCSANLCVPRAIRLGNNVPSLLDEWAFSRLGRDDQFEGDSPNLSACSSSPLAHLVHLNRLLYEIHQVNAMIVDDHVQPDRAQSSIASLSTSLDNWISGLPPEMQCTEANMAHWAAAGFGGIFATLHINYNHAAQLLFYQFLYASQGGSGGPAATKPVSGELLLTDAYARRCKTHAAALCDLIYSARVNHGVDLRFTILAHVLVIASTVHIHSLLFSVDEEEIALAKVRLQRNFETITRLHTYWPAASASFSRLQAFHSACLKSTHSSFRLDRWMLRFMLEFSKPIDERGSGMVEEGSSSVADPEGAKPFDQLRYLLER